MSTPLKTTYLLGTVVRYTPSSRPPGYDQRWCREGMAVADERGRLLDTFWFSSGENHIVTNAEMASVEMLFHLGDYEEIDRYQRASAKWATYHPDDRQVITSQHGLQKRWLIRKGAKPDLGTQIANAEERVLAAEVAVRSAERELEWCREQLSRLQVGQVDS